MCSTAHEVKKKNAKSKTTEAVRELRYDEIKRLKSALRLLSTKQMVKSMFSPRSQRQEYNQ